MASNKSPSLVNKKKQEQALARINQLSQGLLLTSGSTEHKIAKERLLFLLVAEQETIARALIRKAKGGDVKAITEVFNRLYGKPTESIDLGGNVQFSLKKLAEEREMLQTRIIETAIDHVIKEEDREDDDV